MITIFSARSVRDRWVNIRSTFNHNLRRVEKSKETAQTQNQVYVPCWPLWKPLQFLREVSRSDDVRYEACIIYNLVAIVQLWLTLSLEHVFAEKPK